MQSDWQECSWGDLATLEYGKGVRDYKRDNGPYPVYGTNGLIGSYFEPLCDGPGVIIGRKGAYRGVHYSPKPFYVIDTAFYLKPKIDLDIRWAYYELLTHDINGMDSGSAIPSTSREDFYRLRVKLPPLPIQRRIAEILGRLDDKIEVNRRINQTLEQMAQALYQHWFVDFGPFQDGEFVESELGPIPKGWAVGMVSDFGEIVTGKTPSTTQPENFGNEVLFIRIPDMHNQVFVTQTSLMLSSRGAEIQKKKYLPPFSICISCIATPGLVCMTSAYSQTNQQINSIIPRCRAYSEFIYCQMQLMEEQIRLLGSGGSATLNLNKRDFSNMKVVIPAQDTIEAFHKQVNPWFGCILNNQYENQRLAEIRDYLLPKLLSGAISVDAAAEVGIEEPTPP